MPRKPPELEEIARLPLRGRLTPAKWARVERFLDEWQREVLAAARRHPPKSFELGMTQVRAFADLLGSVHAAVPTAGMFGGEGATMREAVAWQQRYLLNELQDALGQYVGRIKDELLYGLRQATNPTLIASALFNATRDASVNWRMIARTEAVRANAAGRLAACEQMGYDRVWAPPHQGSCRRCKQLLENRIFRIEEVRDATNYGRRAGEWVPCIPLHPHCRHTWLPYEPAVYDEMQALNARMEEAGFTDDRLLDEMFDSSGQLKPDYQDVDFSAAKVGPLTVEALTCAVLKTTGRFTSAGGRARRMMVEPDDLKTDLYQRDLDDEKVLAMFGVLRNAGHLPPVRVSRRPDGTMWIVDGQHRAAAYRLADQPVPCDVRDGMTWTDEADECRDLMAKVLDPATEDGLIPSFRHRNDGMSDVGASMQEPAYSPDPLLFDGLRLRDEARDQLTAAWARVAGPEWRRFSALYVPAQGRPEVVVDWPAVRDAHPEWKQLADTDLHLALVLLARERAGELAGRPIDFLIRPEQTPGDFERTLTELRHSDHDPNGVWSVATQSWVGAVPAGDALPLEKALPAYRWSDAPTSLQLRSRWRRLAKTSSPVGWHVAPTAARQAILNDGLLEAAPNDRWSRYGAAEEPAGVYLWESKRRAEKWLRDMRRLVGGHAELAANDLWRVDLTGLTAHPDPVLGDEGAVYVDGAIAPDRLTLATGDVGKVAKMAPAAAANAGVEHWITVHPHGEEEKGRPVLVRNNTDGTMTVIGGAGGHLNYLRIDPRRRISQSDSARRKGSAKPERTLSLEEQQQAQRDLQHTRRQAQRTIETSEKRISDLEDQLRAYVHDQLGAKWLTHGLIQHASGGVEERELGFMERKQAMRKLVQGALQTLTLGQLQQRDASDAPYLFVERQGDFEGMPDGEKKPDEPIEGKAENGELMEPDAPAEASPTTAEQDLAAEERKINRRLPAMQADQAQEILRIERQIARLQRARASARKTLKGDEATKSALALEWTDSDVDEDVRKKVEAEQRTAAARELLDTTERNTYKVSYGRNLHRGAYDTLDSFTHAVLGVSAVSPDVARLLGPEGTAQLIAAVVRDKAASVGDPDKLDLDKPLGALKKLSDQIESDVAQTAAARARTAMQVGVGMRAEQKASEEGDSLWTRSMARSYEIDKLNEASAQLGMAIGGFEAASALKNALEKPPKEIVVGGLESPARVMELAERAGIDVKPGQIERNDSGNYTLRLPLEQVKGLAKLDRAPDWEKRELLRRIRTGKGIAREIEKARSTPGMVDQLLPAQAQGKMFLLASDPPGTHRHWNLTGTPIEKKSEDLRAQLQLGTTLDFAPGVGKTHTAIAAAMQLMNDEPHMNHRALVVVPTTAIAPWAATVQKQGALGTPTDGMGPVTVNALGYGMDVNGPGDVALRRAGKTEKNAQFDAPAHFNIVTHDTLKRDPEIAKKLGCTLVITDETQKFKNERNQRSNALREVGDAIGAERPKVPSRTAWADKFGQLERGYEHITREDKVRQFREGIDDRLFHMSAEDAGNDLPGAEKGDGKQAVERLGFPHTRHQVTLDPDHVAELKRAVQNINTTHSEAKAEGRKGIPFGGQLILAKALYDRPHNAFASKAAEVMADRLSKPIEWDGFHGHPKHADGENAGTYERKGVVFSQFTGTQLAHVLPELEAKGLKTFYAHGGLTNEENDRVLAAFLKHKGKAVLVTSDKNSTARSLQFGDNNGRFQHGATEMLHYSLPDQGGNATVQQRNARILRRGAQVPVAYHTLWGNTPAEQRQMDRLTRELKTQQMAGNSEQLVGGRQTLRHRLSEAGVAPANELADRDTGDQDERPAA